MHKCQDWQILVVWDERSCNVSTCDRGITEKRPDVTIYSTAEKRCLLIELTVPAKENLIICTSQQQKKCKYANVIHECQELSRLGGVKYFPVEVGFRGFTDQTLRTCFKYLDLSSKQIRRAIDDISETA